MILDTLSNLGKYAAINPGLSTALGFLIRSDLSELPDGKHEIDGDRVFAIVAHENGRKVEDAELEGHRKHIDVQYVISGDESMGWAPREGLITSVAYDEERDLEFFKGRPESIVRVPPGSFALFSPEDAHLPLIGDGPIHKVVVKVSGG